MTKNYEDIKMMSATEAAEISEANIKNYVPDILAKISKMISDGANRGTRNIIFSYEKSCEKYVMEKCAEDVVDYLLKKGYVLNRFNDGKTVHIIDTYGGFTLSLNITW